MSPRQLVAWSELIDRDMRNDKADLVEALMWGTSGDGKVLKKLIKKLRENI